MNEPKIQKAPFLGTSLAAAAPDLDTLSPELRLLISMELKQKEQALAQTGWRCDCSKTAKCFTCRTDRKRGAEAVSRYRRLTPENQDKFCAYAGRLLMEQEAALEACPDEAENLQAFLLAAHE